MDRKVENSEIQKTKASQTQIGSAMWILKSVKTDSAFYILPGKEIYTVGRNGTDLVLNGDSSISRTHANIILSENKIQLVDIGSKFGTFYYDEDGKKVQIKKNDPFELRDGQRIHIGRLTNEWTVSKFKPCTLVSTLTSGTKDQLRKRLKSIDGELVDVWKKSCTHLTMPEITVTLKVLQALVENIPIVSVKYWDEVFSNVGEQKPLPAPYDFLPTLAEKLLNKESISFNPNPARKTLFSGKTVIFMAKKHFDSYEPIISGAGGKCKNLNENNIKKSMLYHKNSIVIRYIPSSQSQNSQTIDSITELLNKNGRRLVPDFEIGLAVVNCSIEKYCNPEYDISKEFVAHTEKSTETSNKQVLAEETDQTITENFVPDPPNTLDIPETIEFDEIPKTETFQKPDESVQSEVYDDVSEPQLFVESEPKTKRKPTDDIFPPNKKAHKEVFSTFDEDEELFAFDKTESQRKSKEVSSKRKAETNEVHQSPKRVTRNQSENILSSQRSTQQINLSGFLCKTQNLSRRTAAANVSAVQNRPDNQTKKRPRFANLENEDEDDLFDFGSGTSKKSKQNTRKNSEQETETEETTSTPALANKNLTINLSAKIRNVQTIKATDQWLSKSFVKKEEKQDDEVDAKCDAETLKWIRSIKDAFVVKVKPMNLTVISQSATENGDNTDSATHKGKNFKAFVKKKNYIPQTKVIATVRLPISVR